MHFKTLKDARHYTIEKAKETGYIGTIRVTKSGKILVFFYKTIAMFVVLLQNDFRYICLPDGTVFTRE